MNAKQQYKIAYRLARNWHKMNSRNGMDYAWMLTVRFADVDNIPLHLVSHCILAVSAYYGVKYHH